MSRPITRQNQQTRDATAIFKPSPDALGRGPAISPWREKTNWN